MGDSVPFSGPKDASVMEAILKEMGVEDYQPNVINQMLEFSYRYVTNVLEDARVYSEHAQKKELDISDVKLAIQTRMDHSFTTPPPRDLLVEIARKKNSSALPLIPEKFGPRLPPERYCLTANNYKIMERKKPSTANKPQVTLSATFRVPSKQVTTSSTAPTPTSLLRNQISSPLLQATNLPLTSSSSTMPTQGATYLAQQGVSLAGGISRQSMPTFSPVGQGQGHELGRNNNSSATVGNSGLDMILGRQK